MMGCDGPQYLVINADVLMYDDVSESGDPRPGRQRILASGLFADVAGCFTDDLQVADDVYRPPTRFAHKI